MALMECPECCGRVSDKAASCPHCGCPIERRGADGVMYCPYCGEQNDASSLYCARCGKSMTGDAESDMLSMQRQPKDISVATREKQLEFEQRRIQQEQSRILAEQRRQSELAPRCPKCGSTSLICGKKGYGIGKAAAGAIIAGPIGLLAGGIGMNSTEMRCMSCGHRWTIKSN